MKVLYIKTQKGQGKVGDIKEVSDGFARNMLLPNKIAIQATDDAVRRFKENQNAATADHAVQASLLEKSINDVQGVRVEIKRSANEQGHMYSSVHERDIAEALYDQLKLSLDVGAIHVNGPIKNLGDHEVVASHGAFNARFTVSVTKE